MVTLVASSRPIGNCVVISVARGVNMLRPSYPVCLNLMLIGVGNHE